MNRATDGLPRGWAYPALGELVIEPSIDIVDGPFGSNMKASEYVECGAPIIRLQNVKKNRFVEKNIRFISPEKAYRLRRHGFKAGDIVVSKLGDPLGEACIVPETLSEGIIVADVVRVRLSDVLNKISIMYSLNSEDVQRQFKELTKGTTRPRVNLSHIRGIRVPLPPVREQGRIVAEIEKQFTRLEAAVAALKRVQANLKRYRTSVLKAACGGRLVPTEADLTRAEHRPYEAADQLLARILKERRAKWEADQFAKMQAAGKPPEDDKWKAKYKEPTAPDTSNLPELPQGWTYGTLNQLIGYLRNGFSQKPDAESGTPILRISAVRPMYVDVEDVRYLPGKPDEYAENLLSEGDLLFTRYNGNPALVGVCGAVRILTTPTAHPDKIIRAKMASAGCDSRFLEIVLSTGASREFLARRVRTTAGQSGVSGGDLRVIPVPLAPFNEQRRIVAEVERRLSVIDELEATVEADLKRAERLRQSILKRAFEGKLVPQDPSDEPASVLLERIRAEREVNTPKKARGFERRGRQPGAAGTETGGLFQ